MGNSPNFMHVPNPEAPTQFRRLRMESGLTLEALAVAAGTRPSLIAKYQNGQTRPSLPMATLLEKLVGMPAIMWWNVHENQ